MKNWDDPPVRFFQSERMQTQSGENYINPVPRRTRRHRLATSLMVLLLVPFLLFILCIILISSPPVVNHLSRELSRILGQPVSIDSVSISGGTISISGCAVRNLPPFRGDLLAIRNITIVPGPRLIYGEKDLSLLRMKGVSLSLEKAPSGAWNVAPFINRLKGTSGSGETFIQTLHIDEISVSLNGHQLPLLSITARDMATKGSRETAWEAVFTNVAGRPDRVTGTVLLGTSPMSAITVDAPHLSLDGFGSLLKRASPLDFRNSMAVIHLSAKYHKGLLKSTGTLRVKGISARLKDRSIPLAGTLVFGAMYRQDRDKIQVPSCSIELDGLVSLSGTASIEQLRNTRNFSVQLAGEITALRNMRNLLPPAIMKEVEARGDLMVMRLLVEGDARQGVRTCEGTVTLRNGELAWKGKKLLQGGTANLALRKEQEGWLLAGAVNTDATGSPAELEHLEGGVTAHLTPHLNLVRLDTTPFTAQVRGIDVRGDVIFDASAAEPLSFRLRAPSIPLITLSPFLPGKVRLNAGTASVSLAAAGNAPKNVHGSLNARIEMATGTVAGRHFTVKDGALDAKFGNDEVNHGFETSGDLNGIGLLGSDPAEIRFAFVATPERLRLGRGTIRLGPSRIAFASLEGALALHGSMSASGVPVALKMEGIDVSRDGFLLEGVTGTVAGRWITAQEKGRFVGRADLTAVSGHWRSWQFTGLDAHLFGNSSGVTGDITGKGLGGRVDVTGQIDPYTPTLPASLHLEGRRLSAKQIEVSSGRDLPISITRGILDANAYMSFGRNAVPQITFSITGSDLTVNRKTRTLLTGVALSAEGDCSIDSLTLRRGSITMGEKISLDVSGTVENLYSPARTGEFAVTLAPTPLSTMIDATVNMLPAPLQQAHAEGTVALNGAVTLRNGVSYINGGLSVQNGSISLPSQQFNVDGMEGSLPLSMTLPATGVKLPRRDAGFSRENYPMELATLKRSLGAPTFRIARFRFGPLETGETRFYFKSTGIRSELTRLETSVYGGALIGRGAFAWANSPFYDADLLVNDLSLRNLCKTIPAIDGYLSGKVDGIVSLHGEGGGMNGILGYFSLWTRSGEDEEMLISREFLQKLAGKNLKGFFFRDDRPFDRGEISGTVEKGYVTFKGLDISHTNFLGVQDLGVSVAPLQNRIALDHLVSSIKTAARRGKPVKEGDEPSKQESSPTTEFKWLE